MFVGIARIELHLPGATSLKDKRAIVRGLKERIPAESPKVMLAAEDKVVYKSIVQVMDICLDLGLSAITVANPNTMQGELL